MRIKPNRKTFAKKDSRRTQVAIALAADPNAVFYQGNPCVHGHTGIRYIKDGHCRDCKDVLYAKTSKSDVNRWKG